MQKKEERRVTFSYDLSEGVISYYFDLCGSEFLSKFIVSSGKVSLMVLDDRRGVLVRGLGHDGIQRNRKERGI